MNDIGLFFDGNQIDIQLANGDLVGDSGLETSILISLFSDKRATEDELPENETDPRGWWGDLYPEVEGDQIGSLLWITDRGKATNETLAAVEDFANQALQWLIEDGIAQSVSVSAEYDVNKSLLISIEILRKTGENSQFNYVWDGQELVRG